MFLTRRLSILTLLAALEVQIHRYTGLDAARFAALFNWRLSPFLAQLPPKPYHLLRRTIEENDALRGVWQRANSFRRSLYQARSAK